jgi:tyrosine-protein kinase Etk/Wzc
MLISAQVEIDELQRKLSQINMGTAFGKDDMKVIVPFKKIPELGGEYLRHYRDVEIQYKILQFITPLYEQAKVEEKRQTPSVLILDKAEPAERKSKPKISLYSLLAFIVSILLSLVIVFVHEMIVNLQSKNQDKLKNIIAVLRDDWAGLRIRRKE